MTIRTRLLLLLLPSMIAFITAVSVFLYFHWTNNIIEGVKSNLQTVVTSCAQIIDPDDHNWIDQHRTNRNIIESPTYKRYQRLLYQIKSNLPIASLYTVKIKPVQKGEPVLLDEKIGIENPVFDGVDVTNAYRQVFVIDASAQPPFDDVVLSYPGDMDFSESGEHALYYTKKVMVTAVYKARKCQKKMITAYAPIIDNGGHVTALVGADTTTDLLDSELYRAMIIMIGGGATTILLVIAGALFVAKKIGKPITNLNESALAIASGDYGKRAAVSGPKELADLANTLNTMSECMEEHLARVKENALLKERLYGEYECSKLLQYHMFGKVIEKCSNAAIIIRVATATAMTEIHGRKLKIEDKDAQTTITLQETTSPGFHNLYLLATSNHKPFPQCTITIDTDNNLHTTAQEMPRPMHWKSMECCLNTATESCKVHPKDFILIPNLGLTKLFNTDEEMVQWIAKILRHFATEGIDPLMAMLQAEIDLLAKDHHLQHDAVLLVVMVKG